MIWLFFIIDSLYSTGTDRKPLEPSNKEIIIDLKEIIYYFSFAKSFFYLATAILTIYERNRLMKNIKNSPLCDIDDTLTEDIYNNIIQQCKNPDNHILLEEYKKLVIDKKRCSLNDSQKSSGLTNNPDSINNVVNKDVEIDVKKGICF
jgi:hypothetical protein